MAFAKTEKNRLENDVKNERRRVEALQSDVKALEKQVQ